MPPQDAARAGLPARRLSALAAASTAAAVASIAGLVSSPPAGADVPRRAASASTCRGADTSFATASPARLRSAMICLVNRQRTIHGLRPLRESRRLDRAAQAWTNAMVATHTFAHSSRTGARIAADGYPWTAMGENIATGFSTPTQVVSAWMASQDHCTNILSPMFTDVGGGIAPRPVGGGPLGGTWTLDFGLPRGKHAPSRNWFAASGCPY